MIKYRIELIPSAEKNITLTSSEWAIVVMFSKFSDFNKMVIELKLRMNIDFDEIKQALSSLQKKKILKLLQTQTDDDVQAKSSEATEEKSMENMAVFWDKITKELSRAIGPIADIVIDDAVGEFKASRDNFPSKYLYSLVEKVATEIHTAAEKSQFQKAMLEFIKDNM
ncbi:hypothetical protein MTBBW1_2130090 [Desulfamplus magnetovallimortis]|uniref:DUF8082 domain-containing protein n=1 Tax=Desulfamplus magnetovallimortis TaxID=1246637 RepID=A0A1W1HCT8_9BACT|nr:hypothetical protein [Desulfamplus magnetovallimortis]SLM30195.1 hypothetical protein MTBBW1_2130090 [Desulfamplus magnetovallimortis]